MRCYGNHDTSISKYSGVKCVLGGGGQKINKIKRHKMIYDKIIFNIYLFYSIRLFAFFALLLRNTVT